MSLLRFAARSMLASYFVLNGVRAVARPEEQAAAATPLAEKIMPPVTDALPESLRRFLPADATGFAKLTGVLQIAGGVSLASGLGRRCGAATLALTTVPSLLAANPLAKGAGRVAAQQEFGTNVALLGGLLLAALDTEGKPNLAWRVRTKRELLSKEAAKRKAELQRDVRATANDAEKLTRSSIRKARKAVAEVLS